MFPKRLGKTPNEKIAYAKIRDAGIIMFKAGGGIECWFNNFADFNSVLTLLDKEEPGENLGSKEQRQVFSDNPKGWYGVTISEQLAGRMTGSGMADERIVRDVSEQNKEEMLNTFKGYPPKRGIAKPSPEKVVTGLEKKDRLLWLHMPDVPLNRTTCEELIAHSGGLMQNDKGEYSIIVAGKGLAVKMQPHLPITGTVGFAPITKQPVFVGYTGPTLFRQIPITAEYAAELRSSGVIGDNGLINRGEPTADKEKEVAIARWAMDSGKRLIERPGKILQIQSKPRIVSATGMTPKQCITQIVDDGAFLPHTDGKMTLVLRDSIMSKAIFEYLDACRASESSNPVLKRALHQDATLKQIVYLSENKEKTEIYYQIRVDPSFPEALRASPLFCSLGKDLHVLAPCNAPDQMSAIHDHFQGRAVATHGKK